MPPRVHSQRQAVCTDDAFQRLSTSANGLGDHVEINKRALQEVLDCHARCGARCPRDLQVSGYKVHRKTLFNFLVDHGQCCGTQVAEDWVSDRARRDQRLAGRD